MDRDYPRCVHVLPSFRGVNTFHTEVFERRLNFPEATNVADQITIT